MAQETPPKVSKSILYLLRDVAVAFLIVAVVMAAIFAYTRVWPPMVVVESQSMQHSNTESYVGVIDTGDLVLVQAVSGKPDVTTYLDGRAQNYATYGDYGDVIIFLRNGRTDETPIIHRPLVYLQCNDTAGGPGSCTTYDIPALADLRRGVDWDTTSGRYLNLGSGEQLTLKDVGFKDATLTLSLDNFRAYAVRYSDNGRPYSGYITKGDNNGANDEWLVREDWVIGRARGELPWFGLIKLTLIPSEGNTCRGWGDSCAPANSWASLTVSLIILISAPVAFDVGTTLWKRRQDRVRKDRAKSR